MFLFNWATVTVQGCKFALIYGTGKPCYKDKHVTAAAPWLLLLHDVVSGVLLQREGALEIFKFKMSIGEDFSEFLRVDILK